MRSLPLRLAMGAVRAWTRVYTWRLPGTLGDARREQIESDLWEGEHDPAASVGFDQALRVFARLLIGIPDDFGWRLEHLNTMRGSWPLKIAATGGVAGVLVVWFVMASTASQPPQPPDSPHYPLRPFVPDRPPPPPPPPPPRPGSVGASTGNARVMYARTSYTAGTMRPPRKIKDVPPVYPPIASTAHVQGTVVVKATIDERGRVVDAQIVESVPLFDQAAIDAVSQWRFEPTAVDSALARVVITVTVRFTSPQ